MLFDYNLRNYHLRLILYTTALSIIGIMAIRSASSQDASVAVKQIIGVVVSVTICIIISMIDYHWFNRFSWAIYGVCIAFLILVLIRGRSTNGATRWLKVGPISIQPSEFVKIGLILFMAWYLAKYMDTLNRSVTILRIAALAGLPLILVYLQPNLSTTIIIAVVIFSMLFAAGLSYRWILGTLAFGLPSISALLYLALHGLIPFLKQYQAERILARFFNSDNQYADLNRQQNNSIMAIGSGKLTGKGLFNNTLASVKNGNFLSEERTDFIFAIIGEELGFIGCSVVILLYAFLVFECLWIGAHAKDVEGRIIATGMAALIAFQSFANIAVATGIFPNTGLPLPFISSGLTSLMSMFIGVGIILNIGLQKDTEEQ
ncbi:MAG: rod shape-determining protein RodA [Clostridium sp.]|nr:rod shape-determining protein RodA [Clostridium sp.]